MRRSKPEISGNDIADEIEAEMERTLPSVKKHFAIRLGDEARGLLALLVDHFDPAARAAGRRATQTEVVERAIRCLAEREKISRKNSRIA
jgi:hypothetical protein